MLPELVLPDGRTHVVAEAAPEVIEPMTVVELQALFMAMSELLCNVHGEDFLAAVVNLASTYLDAIAAEASIAPCGTTVSDEG